MHTKNSNHWRVAMTALVIAMGWGTAIAQDASVAAAAKPMPIYANALAPGWQNWSWAKTRLSVGAEGATRKPIAVDADAYTALYLQHQPFSTTGYRTLNLLVQSKAAKAEVKLFLLTPEGKPIGAGKVVKIGNTGWTKVVVPLETLGANDTTVSGLWIQNPTGETLPTFYVADVGLQ